MMLSGEEPVTDLVPRAYKTSIDHRLGVVPLSASHKSKFTGMTLTPELVQQQLQTPRRVSRRMSAFTSPNRRIPTATALAEGELSFFSRVTDTSGSSMNDSSQSQPSQYPTSLLVGTTHHLATVAPPLEYISPATTPALSDTDALPLETLYPKFGSHPTSMNQFHPNPGVVGMNAAGAVVPTVVTPVYPIIPPFLMSPVAQPIHLMEQQQEQLVLQREQELLQLQLQNEFSEEQRRDESAYQNQEELHLRRQLHDKFQHDMNEKKQEDVVSLPSPLLILLEPRSEDEFVDPIEKATNEAIDAVLASKDSLPQMSKIVDHPVQDLEHEKITESNDRLPSVDPEVNYEGSEPRLVPSAANLEILDVDSTRYYSSPTECSIHQQQQCMDQLVVPTVQKMPENNRNQESLSTLSKCRDDRGTPRVSNSASASESDVSSQTDPEETYHHEPDHNWSAATVDAMKATMSRALGKLQTLASHIASTNADYSLPETMNTSTESSSASPLPDNMSNKSLDFQDLADELRGGKGHESEKTRSDEKSPIIRHRRRDSSTSFDTLGAQKPASLVNTSSPPRHLQKPIPLNPLSIHAAHSIPLKKSDRDVRKTGPRFISPPVSSSRTRAVTPIVRMRHQGEELEEETAADEMNRSFDDMNFKSQRNMNRKSKSKPARKNSDNPIHLEKPQHKKKSKHKPQKIDQEDSFFSFAGQNFHVPTDIPSCKNDVLQLLERFMTTRCGNLDDTYDGDEDDDDYSMDTNDVSYCTDEDEPLEPEIAATGLKLSAAKVSRGLQVKNQEENEFAFAEPNYTISVDLNDKQFIRQFIASATSEGILLIRHKENHKKSLRRPTKNLAKITRGVPVPSGKFKGPCLVWREVNGVVQGELDLFDIRSLDKATALELENYPLAMPGRSMIFRMHKGNDFVFEARNEEEALRFVHGMRWLIARLAFNLIIGNISVSCELLEVERSSNADDRYGMFPSSVKEETKWTSAMNYTTNHLVSKAVTSVQHSNKL
jgi:hypothetical protein